MSLCNPAKHSTVVNRSLAKKRYRLLRIKVQAANLLSHLNLLFNIHVRVIEVAKSDVNEILNRTVRPCTDRAAPDSDTSHGPLYYQYRGPCTSQTF